MGALFGQFAVVEYNDIVEAERGKYAVCNDDRCFIMQVTVEAANDLMFCFGINGT